MLHFPGGTVTLLFTDIEGSTRLLQQLGERYAELLAESRQLLESAFTRWHGTVVDTQGDAFFVVFARANDAVAAAVDAQRAFAAHVFPQEASVRVRMGLHTGEPELTSQGYVGLDVHRAARIMSAAHGGQMLLSRTTRDLVERKLPAGVAVQDLGAHQLKDIDEQDHLFQLTATGLDGHFPPLNTPGSHNVLHAFPAQTTSFIGRDRELEDISALLGCNSVRLLTLTGAGGVGKTRLAIEAAAATTDLFVDGTYFVALAQVNEVSAVLPAIAQTLAVREERGQPLHELLQSFLQRKRILLLLDNVEQVISAALLLADLLASCPQLKLLTTSREVLRLQSERVYAVSPFPAPAAAHITDLASLESDPAVALFIQRARAVRPNFRLTPRDAPAVASICARLDGLPLAIELAAARVKYIPPRTVLAQLEQGGMTLKASARDIPARQQTLRDTIAWSYDLLDIEQQRLFRRLAVFANGCTLEAIEQVCGAAGDTGVVVMESLEMLVDKSLLRQEQEGVDLTRFSLLQTLREYASECLVAAGELEVTRDAHASYFVVLAEEIAPELAGAEEARWLDYLETEHENLRLALGWLLEQAGTGGEHAGLAVRLCSALSGFWEIRGYFQEARSFLQRLLAASQGAQMSARAQTLYLLAMFHMMSHEDIERGEAFLQESLVLFSYMGDTAGRANVLHILGQQRASKKTIEARSLLEMALALYEEISDLSRAVSVRDSLASVASLQGDYAGARALLEQNLACFDRRADTYSRAYSLYLLACVLFLAQDEQKQAQALAEESLALFRAVGDRRFICKVLNLLGRVFLHQGELQKARASCEESVTLAGQAGDRGIAECLLCLGQVMAAAGGDAAAYSCYTESWAFIRERGSMELCASCLEALGELLVMRGLGEMAARMWGKAATLRAELVAPMPPVVRASYGRAVAAARARLGPQAFQAAWAAGRDMPLAEISL